MSLESLSAAARIAIAGDAEGLLVSCTGLRSTELIVELEAEFGRPVITSLQAMWWEAVGPYWCSQRRPGTLVCRLRTNLTEKEVV